MPPQPALHQVMHQVAALVAQTLVADGVSEVVSTRELHPVCKVVCTKRIALLVYTTNINQHIQSIQN